MPRKHDTKYKSFLSLKSLAVQNKNVTVSLSLSYAFIYNGIKPT